MPSVKLKMVRKILIPIILMTVVYLVSPRLCITHTTPRNAENIPVMMADRKCPSYIWIGIREQVITIPTPMNWIDLFDTSFISKSKVISFLISSILIGTSHWICLYSVGINNPMNNHKRFTVTKKYRDTPCIFDWYLCYPAPTLKGNTYGQLICPVYVQTLFEWKKKMV